MLIASPPIASCLPCLALVIAILSPHVGATCTQRGIKWIKQQDKTLTPTGSQCDTLTEGHHTDISCYNHCRSHGNLVAFSHSGGVTCCCRVGYVKQADVVDEDGAVVWTPKSFNTGTPAPNGLVRVDNRFYHFIHVEKNHADAKSDCQSREMYLFVIDTADKVNALSEALNDAYAANNIWTSATDVVTEGTYIWEPTGEELPLSSDLWESGQPGGGSDKNCVVITSGHHLDDMPCSFEYVYTCEVHIV